MEAAINEIAAAHITAVEAGLVQPPVRRSFHITPISRTMIGLSPLGVVKFLLIFGGRAPGGLAPGEAVCPSAPHGPAANLTF